MKPPSRYDGKPVGTPTDAKAPYFAGVTMGADQVERDALARRLAKKTKREAAKARRMATPNEDREAAWVAHRRRRKRAQTMKNSIENRGRTVAWVAEFHGLTPDAVLAEIAWLKQRQDRHRREKHSKQETRRIHAALVSPEGAKEGQSPAPGEEPSR